MWYVFICEDAPNSSALRKQTREAHLARLHVLNDSGRLFTAGPCPTIDSESPGDAGFTGSLIIADFPSLADAEAWANDDPYRIAGVYESVVVKPYKLVFP